MRRQLRGSVVVATPWIAFVCVAVGCGDAEQREPGQERGIDAAMRVHDDGGDAEPRVKERTVAFELPPIARRTFHPGPEGEFVYGEIEPIEGAETCVVQRRAAFASFAPFSPLEEPICVTTAADEVVRLEGVPASSDLLITVTKAGFVPATLTFRVETADVAVPAYFGTVRTVLLEPGQADPWRDARVPASETGQVGLYATMVWGAATEAVGANQGLGYEGLVSTWATASGVRMTLDLETDDAKSAPLELDTPSDRPMFMELPAGSYRVQVTHPRAHCEPTAQNSYTPWGLGADASDLELPVLAGHHAALVAACWCFPSQPDQASLDLATCTYAESATP